MEHAKHIWRAVLILVFGLVTFIVVTHFLVPGSFGKEGHYRWDSVSEQMDKPVVHGGRDSCKKCHPKQYETVMKGKHAAVNCETCHMPLPTHITKDKDGNDVRNKMEVYEGGGYELCLTCHQKLAGRPDEKDSPYRFPQIVLAKHRGKKCLMCHESAHAPVKPPDEEGK